MSQLSAEEEAELAGLLRQLLQSVQDRITGAPSVQSAEDMLLHLEETDKNYHNYEFVKYVRRYVESSLAAVVEAETEKCVVRGDDGHAVSSAHDTLISAITRTTRASPQYHQMIGSLKASMHQVIESLTNQYEEGAGLRTQHRGGGGATTMMDNCSDSDSSFNQSYAFIKQEQLQVLAENLDPSRPKEVRWEALQALCQAPPSDVLSSESWSALSKNLTAALSDPDPALSDKVLRFFSKTFSSSPLNVTREIYTSLAQSVQCNFLSNKLTFPTGSAALDVNTHTICCLLKQLRLMNEFQKDVTTFWIRHPEKYMEEIIESTLALLSSQPEQGASSSGGPEKSFQQGASSTGGPERSSHQGASSSGGPEKSFQPQQGASSTGGPERSFQQGASSSGGPERRLQPVHLLTLLDIKASWFKTWMHGYYSRTVVLKLLQRKYKSLVAAAVQQCIHYNESRAQDATCTTETYNISSVQRSVYSGPEIDYAYFVHSLCILGKLMVYADGRKLFPVTVSMCRDPVSLTDLLVILINIMFQHPDSDPLSPSSLVLGVLRTLCEHSQCADAHFLHGTPVIQTLLTPVIRLLNGHTSQLKRPSVSLTHMADILARLASTDRGLALFLYEHTLTPDPDLPERTSAGHVIVRFTQRVLGEDLVRSLGSGSGDPAAEEEGVASMAVGGALVLVCRQMYNTCAGLQVLMPYGLHASLSRAWTQVSSLTDRVPTPPPGSAPSGTSQELKTMLLWEETLLDSLLNFAATPKGVLLLHQTGAMTQCVRHMFTRYMKKLQVSRCERFGYGVMVTQIAATTPGAMALHSSGFVQALVVEMWACLECGRDHVRVEPPQCTLMDRSKSFLSLVNLLSSFHCVVELLGQKTLPNKTEYSLREMPRSIPDLFDRLIAVNSDAKIHSLFNYEQSHTFGLRLLSVLCSNLDTFLLLETQYNVVSMMLSSQTDNCTEEGVCIIDSVSVERNHVLVRVGVIGGPSERWLPPRDLQEGPDPYPWPMFCCYPVPRCYTLDPPHTHHSKPDSAISAFLSSSSSSSSESWVEECRRHYCITMATTPTALTSSVIADLLEQLVDHLSSSQTQHFFPPPRYKAEEQSVDGVVLSDVQQLGVNLCVRYGRYLRLLPEDAERGLSLLLKHCQLFLSSQRSKTNVYPGHDWLVSTVFIMMGGRVERCLRVLLKLCSLLPSAFLWPARALHSGGGAGMSPVYWCSAHYVELILKAELPLVHSAFRMSGYAPSQMVIHWLDQVLWNFVDWSEVCQYVAVVTLMGTDYQVYLCASLMKHLQPDILQRAQSSQLQLHLKEEPIRGFRVCDYLEYMQTLERRYRHMVLTDMENITKPLA